MSWFSEIVCFSWLIVFTCFRSVFSCFSEIDFDFIGTFFVSWFPEIDFLNLWDCFILGFPDVQ